MKARIVLANRDSFTARLLSLRQDRGLTRYAIARLADLAPSHYTRIESGECDPQLDTVRRLAAALKVRLDELV